MTATDLKKYIFQNGKIQDILESIGCHDIFFHSNKDYYSCANPDGDNPTAINIFNNEYLGYVNWTRGVQAADRQDLISLVSFTKKCSFKEALKYMHSVLGLEYKFTKLIKNNIKQNPLEIFEKYRSRSKVAIQDFVPMDESILSECTDHIHIDLYREGIMPRTIKKFGLGYSYKRKRTIFPVRYWQTGERMGYNSRTSVKNCEMFGIPKYWITSGMNKNINLYGLYENYDSIEKKGHITIFEAEKSVLKRHSLFDETGVALQGHFMSEEQVRIILGLRINEVILALDKDVDIFEILAMCEKFYSLKKISFIFDKWEILRNKDSPADTSDSQYEFLFKNRIQYNETIHEHFRKKMRFNGSTT